MQNTNQTHTQHSSKMEEDLRTRGSHLWEGRRDLAGSGRIWHCLQSAGRDLTYGNGLGLLWNAGLEKRTNDRIGLQLENKGLENT